jgi:hypothetical protein
MATGVKQKSKTQKKTYTDYSGKGDTRDDTGGDDDLPEKKKKYVRGEQIDQFSVYLKPTRVRNQTVIRWLATRSSGKDKIRFQELIQAIQTLDDGNYKLTFSRQMLKNRGLSDNKLKDYLHKLGFEVHAPEIKDYGYYILIPLTQKMDVDDAFMRIAQDPNAEYSVGGVSLLWGDFIPYYDENYMMEQYNMNNDENIARYAEYIENNQLKTTPYFDEIESPPFSCLRRIGKMYFRGSCNSSGLFVDILTLKRKFQNFMPAFDYMPDVNVTKKIMSMVYEQDIPKSTIYQPAKDIFAFSFQNSLNVHKLPFLLICDMMFSFSKMIERDVEVKVSLRDNPVSCASLDTCLPYFSAEEIIILNKLSKLLDIEAFESEDIEKETERGKRCRVQVFGSNDELDQWKESNPEIENDWFFHQTSKSKNLRYSPRSIRRNQQVVDYQTAFDEMTPDQRQDIVKRKTTISRRKRGYY